MTRFYGFISKYQEGLSKESSPIFARNGTVAINYYNDFIKANKSLKQASDAEKALVSLLQN